MERQRLGSDNADADSEGKNEVESNNDQAGSAERDVSDVSGSIDQEKEGMMKAMVKRIVDPKVNSNEPLTIHSIIVASRLGKTTG